MPNSSILVTGGSGLVGSRVCELLPHYRWDNVDLSSIPSVDITNKSQVIEKFSHSDADTVIHYAAFTDVTKAWEETGNKDGIVYRVNVNGTRTIAEACLETGKRLIHISTAYIFNGEKESPYTESDSPSPIEWYGETKALAEAEVQAQAGLDWTILRIDNPFRQTPFSKPDIVRRIMTKLMDGSLPPQFTDSHFGPTVVENFATCLNWILTSNAVGIYHATNNEAWTPYDFTTALAKRIGKENVVVAGLLTDYLKTVSRPYQRNTALDSSKLLRESGLNLTTVSEAVAKVQLS